MKTYVLEGTVTALTAITHNGGEQNGTMSQLRRHKVVQPDHTVEHVPVVSGNSLRGLLRDVGFMHMFKHLGYGMDEETGMIKGLSLKAFYFFFSGGGLSSTGDSGLDIERYRELKQTIPLVGLFGGASGNNIMPGKIKIHPLMPIVTQTAHLIPSEFVHANLNSVWDYCDPVMYTRKDDEKNDKLRGLIGGDDMTLLQGGADKKEITKSATAQQMMYHVETLAAGTPFYWKIVLEDVTTLEYEAFVNALYQFSRSPYIGGKSGIGHGEISIKLDKWMEIDSRISAKGNELARPLLVEYYKYLDEKGQKIRNMAKEIQ